MIDKEKIKEEFKQRLNTAFDKSDITKDAIAEHFEISPQAVGKWFKKGTMSKDRIPELAILLGANYLWLATGNDKILNNADLNHTEDILPTNQLDNLKHLDNTAHGQKDNNNYKQHPLLSYDQVRELMTEYNSDDHFPVRAEKNIPKYIRIEITGDSMLAPEGATDTFPANTLITINTHNKQPKEGQFIIAMVEISQAINFRQFRISENAPLLHALNPNYKPIFDKFDVIGTLTHSIYEKNY